MHMRKSFTGQQYFDSARCGQLVKMAIAISADDAPDELSYVGWEF